MTSSRGQTFDYRWGMWRRFITLHLAIQFPDHFVIGVDQSADRIARNTQWPHEIPKNFTRVRADLADYWRLLLQSGIPLERHYILYPNPWPKIGHLARR